MTNSCPGEDILSRDKKKGGEEEGDSPRRVRGVSLPHVGVGEGHNGVHVNPPISIGYTSKGESFIRGSRIKNQKKTKQPDRGGLSPEGRPAAGERLNHRKEREGEQ